MYLTYDDTYWALDIETDDLDATVIWCMCYENIITGETGTCITYEEMRKFFKERPNHYFTTHNGLRFDIPVINRILGLRLGVSRVVDTLVLTTLYSPSIQGGHSLGAWGSRIGFEKGEFSDWSCLSDDMVTYCRQDVKVTAELYRKITKVLNKIGFSEKSCYIQHNITAILERQRKNGFCFDGRRAISLYQELRSIEEELQDEIRKVFPPERCLVATREVYKKDGKFTAIYKKDSERHEVVVNLDNTYSVYETVPFNIGSPKQRAEKLLELGWVPDEYTPPSITHPKGQPKVTEKSLVEFAETTGKPEIALITKWMSVNGRANMIRTWLNEWNEDDGCIHGRLFVADTLRFRHQAPNTANIPAVRQTKTGEVLYGESGYYTYEARDLWVARPGRVLVGTDASGLELRMLAHYLNRPEFTDGVINGDPHQVNADLVGITRPQAKTLIYAICYGAGGAKIAKTLGLSVREGNEIRERFLDRLGIADVMKDAMKEQKKGRVWLVDGSGVICPSPHAALNYRLQGGGARVMALGAIFLEGHIRRAGLDSLKVGDIHDEWQYDVHPSCASEHGRLAIQSIREAGEELNLNVPLDGVSKQGLTWGQTH